MLSRTGVPRPVILSVEDDRLLCQMLAILVRAQGWTAECAHDGVEALQAIDRHVPPAPSLSLVLLDVHLPVLDGQTLLAYLRLRGPTVPVVVISADSEALAAARSWGAAATMEKPLDLEHVLKVVTERLQLRAN